MADVEQVIAYTLDKKLVIYFEQAGPSSYSSGGFNITLNKARRIEKVPFIIATSGYLAEVASITDNVVKAKVYYFQYSSTVDGAAIEVPDGTDLSAMKVIGIALTT